MNTKVKRISLMSMLIALSVVGRLFLSFVPNIQPVTTIIILSSFILSPIQAFTVAILGVLISNMFLGMGYWTFYQILAWGIIGSISGVIGKYHHRIPTPILSLYAGLCGLLYGVAISVPMAHIMGVSFWVYYLAGLPFDLSHAIGNAIFFSILYPVFFKTLKNYIDKYKK